MVCVCLKPSFSRQPHRSFPAIALPALTGQTLIDVKRIVCPDPEVAKQASPTLVVAYELEDLVFSQQKLRGNRSYFCCFLMTLQIFLNGLRFYSF